MLRLALFTAKAPTFLDVGIQKLYGRSLNIIVKGITFKHMERKAATPRGLARYLRPCRSGLLGDEAAQDSPPGKRPPVVECAITLNLYCRLYS